MIVERVEPPLNGTKLTNGMQGVNERIALKRRPIGTQDS